MKTFKMLAALGVMASTGLVWAQYDHTVRDAGSKMRDEAITGHEFRSYQRSAQEKAQAYYHRYYYPQTSQQAQTHPPLVTERHRIFSDPS